MSYALNNVTTLDDYDPSTTLQCAGVVKVNIQVYNKAIFYKYSVADYQGYGGNPQGAAFNPEVYLAPGIYLMARRAAQVAVRSAVAGAAAQVTIEALTPTD